MGTVAAPALPSQGGRDAAAMGCPGGTTGTKRTKMTLTALFWTHPIAGASFCFQLGSTGPVAAVMAILGPNPGNRGKKAALALNNKK